jgi:uncharacterized protein (TIGR03000 family)
MHQRIGSAILAATAALLFQVQPALAQRGGHGGGHGGGHAAGGHAVGHAAFSGGFRSASSFSHVPAYSAVRPAGLHYGTVGGLHYGGYPYNHFYGYNNYYHNRFFRPYYASSFYLPYYGFGGFWPYGLGFYGAYAPYYGGLGMAAYASAYPPIVDQGQPQVAPPTTGERPPPDEALHLQLTVPENAEVIIDGVKTTGTGTTREFVSPPLSQGSRYTYKVTVRHMDANGKTVDDVRDIRFQANDWFSIDFTRPAPGPMPLPLPKPKTTKDE